MGVHCRQIVVLVLAAQAFGAGIYVCFGRTSITEENLDRIGPGMSTAEVEAILSGPAPHVMVIKGVVQDSRTFLMAPGVRDHGDRECRDYEVRAWVAVRWSDTVIAAVVFDKGRVVSRFHLVKKPGRWERLKSQLRAAIF
jgi:hypothetical protein